MTRKKVVMYLPCRGDPEKGELISADLLPLELQQIAGVALARGGQVEFIDSIDSMVEQHPIERVLADCEHASVDVYPYRPIPGAALWQCALDAGYQPPTTAAEWGQMCEYKVDSWKGVIPQERGPLGARIGRPLAAQERLLHRSLRVQGVPPDADAAEAAGIPADGRRPDRRQLTDPRRRTS